MKVLVTGGNGFIGQHVSDELDRRGHKLIYYDKPQGDVLDQPRIEFACREFKANAIINLAGVLGTPELFGHETYAAKVNIIGAINVYDTAAKLDIPVVQIGTGHKGQLNPYAVTKACAEDLGIARAKWMGEKIAVVRAYHVYGPKQLPGPPFGLASVHKFFPTFACRALQKFSRLPLELCGGGSQLIDPVYAADVAKILVDAIGGPYGEVTEAGCGKPVSVFQVATDIAMAAGWDATSWPWVKTPGRAGEPADAEVVAQQPACRNPWPYMVPETVGWYREYLAE